MRWCLPLLLLSFPTRSCYLSSSLLPSITHRVFNAAALQVVNYLLFISLAASPTCVLYSSSFRCSDSRSRAVTCGVNVKNNSMVSHGPRPLLLLLLRMYGLKEMNGNVWKTLQTDWSEVTSSFIKFLYVRPGTYGDGETFNWRNSHTVTSCLYTTTRWLFFVSFHLIHLHTRWCLWRQKDVRHFWKRGGRSASRPGLVWCVVFFLSVLGIKKKQKRSAPLWLVDGKPPEHAPAVFHVASYNDWYTHWYPLHVERLPGLLLSVFYRHCVNFKDTTHDHTCFHIDAEAWCILMYVKPLRFLQRESPCSKVKMCKLADMNITPAGFNSLRPYVGFHMSFVFSYFLQAGGWMQDHNIQSGDM